MKRIALFAACLWCCCSIFDSLIAQTLSDYASKYTGDNGKKYMQPLADAFGANLNSGFYHDASISIAGFHLLISVETMSAVIASDQKTFKAHTEDPFRPTVTDVTAPTIFGNVHGTSVEGDAGTKFIFPGGLNLKSLPIAVPQVTIGSFSGTEASIRWIQLKISETIGKLKLFGFGAQHNLNNYIPAFPLDLAANFFIQDFKVGDVVDASTFYLGFLASRSFGVLDLYGGIGYETAKLRISYEEIAYDVKANNSIRLTLGAGFSLPGLKIHADYNVASQNVLAVGLGFGF